MVFMGFHWDYGDLMGFTVELLIVSWDIDGIYPLVNCQFAMEKGNVKLPEGKLMEIGIGSNQQNARTFSNEKKTIQGE